MSFLFTLFHANTFYFPSSNIYSCCFLIHDFLSSHSCFQYLYFLRHCFSQFTMFCFSHCFFIAIFFAFTHFLLLHLYAYFIALILIFILLLFWNSLIFCQFYPVCLRFRLTDSPFNLYSPFIAILSLLPHLALIFICLFHCIDFDIYIVIILKFINNLSILSCVLALIILRLIRIRLFIANFFAFTPFICYCIYIFISLHWFWFLYCFRFNSMSITHEMLLVNAIDSNRISNLYILKKLWFYLYIFFKSNYNDI